MTTKLLIVCVCLCAQARAQSDIDCDEALLRFRSGGESAWCRVVYEIRFSGAPTRSEVAVSAWNNGDCIYTIRDHGIGQTTRPKYFVAIQGDRMYSLEGTNSRHMIETDTGSFQKSKWGPPQWDLCPWPVVDQIAEKMLAGNDCMTRWIDSEILEVRSSHAERILHIGRRGELRRLEQGSEGASFHQVVLYKYKEHNGKLIPTEVLSTITAGDGPTARYFESHYVVTAWSTASNSDPQPAAFDPAAWGVLRLDPASGDVTSLDGEFLYNQHEEEAEFQRRMGLASSGTYGLLYWLCGGLAAGAVVIAWKRRRGVGG